jgi:hypothetical protein
MPSHPRQIRYRCRLWLLLQLPYPNETSSLAAKVESKTKEKRPSPGEIKRNSPGLLIYHQKFSSGKFLQLMLSFDELTPS